MPKIVDSGTVTWSEASGNLSATATGFDAAGSAAAVQSNLDDHEADTSNPHSTTAAQVSAVPTSGGTISGDLTVSGLRELLLLRLTRRLVLRIRLCLVTQEK